MCTLPRLMVSGACFPQLNNHFCHDLWTGVRNLYIIDAPDSLDATNPLVANTPTVVVEHKVNFLVYVDGSLQRSSAERMVPSGAF